MQQIMLTQGYFTIVDDEDYDWLRAHKWVVFRHEYKDAFWCYASRHSSKVEGRKTILMHRVILDCPDGLVIDHINGNGLDNRCCNLRICTQEQNLRNRQLHRSNRSGYHGVQASRGKWCASIRIDGQNIRIGWFDDPIEAAKAYDERALNEFGEFARLNFPTGGNNNEGQTEMRPNGRVVDRAALS